jgi:hypothetical protein
MSAHACQPGQCPDQQLVQAARFVLLATQPGRDEVRRECQALIELVQSARAGALRAGPSWSEPARVNLWNALGVCTAAHIQADAVDGQARDALAGALAGFERRVAAGELGHPPCAEPGITWSWSVLDHESDLAVRAIVRTLAAAVAPEAKRQIGLCQALGLALRAEAWRWTWPGDERQEFQVRLLSLLLTPIAVEFSRQAAGQTAPPTGWSLERRVKTLRDILHSFRRAAEARDQGTVA